jgi:HAD-superfamily hydrolase, subfamily IIB
MSNIFDGILLVSDIDGTFAGSDKVFNKENLKSVKYFTDNGGLFTFATGRFEKNEKMLEIKDHMNAPAICANGASLYDFQTETLIYKQGIDGELLKDKLYDIQEKYNCLKLRYTYEDAFVYLIKRREKIFTYDWYKAVIEDTDNTGTNLDKFRKDIEKTCGDIYYYSKSEPHLFEILDKTATKGTMLTKLREHLDAKYNKKFKIYAIGDYENDIPMLEVADVAVCPENALPMVKAVRGIRTVRHHNRGAVADLIRIIEEDVKKEIKHG